MPGEVIDSHAHCGAMDRSMPQSFKDYLQEIVGTDISGVAFFSPVLEIYNRYDSRFTDNDEWRQRRKKSNSYLLSLKHSGLCIFPYFFIWNDFAVEQLTPSHRGIKWHRHPGEPIYHYEDPRCRVALNAICRKNLPVVLEEEFGNTLRFIQDFADGIRVIIPHLGLLNGGFRAIAEAGLWEQENVWADTALASRNDISEYIRCYGYRRLMFGSDFPFGNPSAELGNIRDLGLDQEVESAVLGGNFMRLQDSIRPGK